MTIQDFDAFDAGNDLEEQKLDLIGFRRIQHMNENLLHKGTAIMTGGYCIKDDMGNAPRIGKTETIKHKGGGTSVMVTAPVIEVALIGFTNEYRVLQGTDADGKYRAVYVPEWMKSPPDGFKMRGGISLFVVLKADPDQELYELSFKSYPVAEAKGIISKLLKACAQMGTEYTKLRNKPTKFHPFAFWLQLGVTAESRMVGPSTDQSAITPPELKTPLDRVTLEKCMVTKDEYLHFIELRKQVDEYLATGRYQGQYNSDGTVALPAGMLPMAQLPAGNGHNDDIAPF